MKSVGIMTWFFAANYGAKAQAYAMQKVLESLSYDAYMINYKPMLACAKEFWSEHNKPVTTIKRFNSLRKAIRLFNLTKTVKDATDVNLLNFDSIIFGSDAIFNVLHPMFNPIYYGVGITTNKIAFSPSCEYLSPQTVLEEDIKKSLKEFRGISVRDKNTAELISTNIDVKPIITCDPTILYNYDEIDEFPIDDNYLLVYSFSDWKDYSDKVKKYAKTNGLKIVSVGQKCTWSDMDLNSCSLEVWISAFKHASIIFTDSFHGTVFSIKNNKDFILCGRKDKSAKICSLLNDLCIDKQFYKGNDIENYLNQKIDYKTVNDRLNEIKNISIDYLKDNLCS